jgi:hypothetical protein
MTTVEILYRYETPPTELQTSALASTKDVYGIRRLTFDRAAKTLRVEYDATRLNAAAVTQLIRQAGLDVEEVQPESALPIPPEPAPIA